MEEDDCDIIPPTPQKRVKAKVISPVACSKNKYIFLDKFRNFYANSCEQFPINSIFNKREKYF